MAAQDRTRREFANRVQFGGESGLLDAHHATAATDASDDARARDGALGTGVMGHERLVAAVARAGLLDERGLRALKEVLLRLANVETMALVRGARGARASGSAGAWAARIRDREVLHTAAVVERILSLAHASALHARSAPSEREAGNPS